MSKNDPSTKPFQQTEIDISNSRLERTIRGQADYWGITMPGIARALAENACYHLIIDKTRRRWVNLSPVMLRK